MFRVRSVGELREERREETSRKPLANSTPIVAMEAAPCLTERELIQWERQLLNREREMLVRERENMESQRTSSFMNETRAWIKDAAELVPIFDPARNTTLPSNVWVRKVENVARLYGWDQRTTLLQAVPKLRNAARHWFNSRELVMENWTSFKEEFVKAFPSVVDEIDVHNELLRRTKRCDEGYDNYVYEMAAIAAKASLSEESIIKYVIAGMTDKEMRKILTLSRFETIQELLRQVKAYEIAYEMPSTSRSESKTKAEARRSERENVPNVSESVKCFKYQRLGHKAKDCTGSKKSKCFTCGSEEHLARNCPMGTKRRCYVCDQPGHLANECPEKKSQVKKIYSMEDPQKNEFHKLACVNGVQMSIFVDLGCDTVTLRKTDAERAAVVTTPCAMALRGFAGGKCRADQRGRVVVDLDGLTFETEVYIVPNETQDTAMILGRDVLETNDIEVKWASGSLELRKCSTSGNSQDPGKEDERRVMCVRKALTINDLQFGEEVSNEEKDSVLNLANEHRNSFALNLTEIGCVNEMEMVIKMKSTEPVRRLPYRTPYAKRKIINDMVEELLSAGLIRESTSEYGSPVLLVKKNTGGERMVIDYRELNRKIESQSVPMPIIGEMMDQLAGKKLFTMLDLASGYYQIRLAEESRKLTAFVTTEGKYEWNVLPFGLVTAPMEFCTMMRKFMENFEYGEVLFYMDDVLIPSVTIEEGLKVLEKVLVALGKMNLTLNPKKCRFLCNRIEYLGFEIDRHGVRPGKRKTAAIEEFEKPKDVHAVRQFLGITGFFRKFIKDYAIKATPLTELTKKAVPFKWDERAEGAFQRLKEELVERPVLQLYDPEAELELHTDASKLGLAGVLLQKSKDGKLGPVAYFSRKTSVTEAVYHSYELETLAMVEAAEKFRVYLLGRRFKVVTACEAVKSTVHKKEIVPRIARWVLRLQEYDYEVEHKAGARMGYVDALSRNPVNEAEDPEPAGLMVINIGQDDWLCTMQWQDPKIQKVLEGYEAGDQQIRTDYVVDRGRVFRRTDDGHKWYVPKGVRRTVVKNGHDDVGHYGMEKTMEQIRKYYWFPKMRRFVKSYLDACVPCAYHKIRGGMKEGELHPIPVSTVPFAVAHVDHMGPFVKTKKGKAYVLAYIDGFTRYVTLRAVRDTTAKLTIEELRGIFSTFGPPKTLISDQGTAFTAKAFEEYCEENDITHVKNATATSRANGQIERYNRTVLSAMRTMVEEETEWDKKLSELQWGLNSLKYDVTKMSPHEVLFSYEPRNAVGNRLLLALHSNMEENEMTLDERRELVKTMTSEERAKQKAWFDARRRKPTQYKERDLVLVEREHAATGASRKLKPKFKGPYQVKRVLGNDRYLLTDIPGAERSRRRFERVYASDRMKRWCTLEEDTGSEDEDTDEDNETDTDKYDTTAPRTTPGSGWTSCKAQVRTSSGRTPKMEGRDLLGWE